MNWQILHGDVRERLKDLAPSSVDPAVSFERLTPTSRRHDSMEAGHNWHQHWPAAEAATKRGGYGYRVIQCPHWLILVGWTLVAGPAALVIVQRSRRRHWLVRDGAGLESDALESPPRAGVSTPDILAVLSGAAVGRR